MDEDPAAPFEWQPIRIQTTGRVTATQLAPFLDEAHNIHQWIDVSLPALGNEPPAADLTEIVVVIAIPVGIYCKAFIEAWAAEDARTLRTRLLEVARSGIRPRDGLPGRTFMPLGFTVGRTRYVVRDPIDEAQLQIALKVLPSSEEQLASSTSATEHPSQAPRLFWWNPEQRRWE